MVIRRWVASVGAAVVLAVAGGLIIGYRVPPVVSVSALPQSLVVDGVTYRQAASGTPRPSLTLRIPATARPVLVRAVCHLAVLHGEYALSELALETVFSRTAGGVLPETGGSQYLDCGRRLRLQGTVDPAWLPASGTELVMSWSVTRTSADAPSDAPASWALAVYTA